MVTSDMTETIFSLNTPTIKVPKSMTKSSVRRSLRKVDLSGNQLATIDDKFWLNTNLESVDLSNNKEPRGGIRSSMDYEISIYFSSSTTKA